MCHGCRTFAAYVPGHAGGPMFDYPLFASRLAAARIRATTLEHYELQALSAIAAGGSPGLAASVMKIVGTELSQHLTELALDAAGVYGRAYQPQAFRPGGDVMLPHASGETKIGRASCRERVCQYV